MRAALYARVSTRDKGHNPEVQLEALRKYCTAMEWEVAGEYVDLASAADLAGRTAWTRLMKDASVRKFDMVLIWKLDRAFRSVIHAANSLEILKGYKVAFKSYQDASIDTSNINGILVFDILAAVAQFEKDLITLRINEGIQHGMEHGTKSGRPIGRKAHDIPLQTICNAVLDSKGSYSQAAKELSKAFHTKLTTGFISLRIKRAGLTKEELLQTRGDFPTGIRDSG